MIANVVLVASMFAILAAGIGGWSGRHLRTALVIGTALFAINIALAWNASDPVGTTIEGNVAASGIFLAISMFILTIVAAVIASWMRSLLRS